MRYDDDVLVFIEAIPSYETRNFVQKVIANIWAYRARFGEPLHELDAVAAGAWPLHGGRPNRLTPGEPAAGEPAAGGLANRGAD